MYSGVHYRAVFLLQQERFNHKRDHRDYCSIKPLGYLERLKYPITLELQGQSAPVQHVVGFMNPNDAQVVLGFANVHADAVLL